MGLQHTYSLIAPLYDPLVDQATRRMRADSLAAMGDVSGETILIPGIGTGLDIPLLPAGARYEGLDLTPAMLNRARVQLQKHPCDLNLRLGDAQSLPYANDSMDKVIMHLILAVVPEPSRALQEARRVVKPGGQIYIVDKFLRPDEKALLRRLISPLMRHIATNTNVVFEALLTQCPDLKLISNQPGLAGGWFRRIVLEKDSGPV